MFKYILLVVVSFSAIADEEKKLFLGGNKWKVTLDGVEKIKNDSHLTITSDDKSASYVYQPKNTAPEVLLKTKDADGNVYISEYLSPYAGGLTKKFFKLSGSRVVAYIQCQDGECFGVDESICESVLKNDGIPDLLGSVRKNNISRSEQLLKNSFKDHDATIKKYFGREVVFRQAQETSLDDFREPCNLYSSILPRPSQAGPATSRAKSE